jgi:DNA-binding winged helix-turn-helix (wHTH) protein
MERERHCLFSPFHLDLVNQRLWRGDEEIRLRRKTFEVLCYLVERPSRLVTKRALLDAIWTKAAVSDSMPAICIGELRKVLGDKAKRPRFIETVNGRGYRFVAPVTILPRSPAPLKLQDARPVVAPVTVGREKELAIPELVLAGARRRALDRVRGW